MSELIVNKNDELVMRLLHYFIIEQGYNPIVLHGAKDEIWLENLNHPYKVVRIVTNYIHNNEQLKFDVFKTTQIVKKIKQKTFSFKVKTLSILLNVGENVQLDTNHIDNISVISINDVKDLTKYSFVIDYFPNIDKKTSFKEKGAELFMKLTSEINKKSETNIKTAEDIFRMKKPVATYALMAINIFIFFVMVLMGNSLVIPVEILEKFGALEAVKVIDGEYYRILFSTFLHADILHLAFNMYALYIIGQQIESFLGKSKFVAIYLYSGLIASLMSMVFSTNIISVGASGSIFGLLGALLYFGYHYRIYLGGVIKSQIIPLIALNLFLGFMSTGIDNAAHVGGLIGGVLVTMSLGINDRSGSEDKLNGLILSAIFTVFLIYMVFIQK